MAKAANGNGPGLSGIFLQNYPAYSYQGPIDMRYSTFTPSALNRFVGQAPLVKSFLTEQQIAKGKKFADEAKFLNDIYGLVRNTVSLYSPELAENVAPLVLTDEIVPGAAAWYTPRFNQIFQPVYDVLPASGYYTNPADTVIGFDSQNQPTQYVDYFVSEKGKRIPVYASSLPHEVGHSLDEFQGEPLSRHDKNLWDYVTKDWYLYPREYNPRTNKIEAFAEYFSDAMQSGYVNKLPELQELYQQTSQRLPYSLEDTYPLETTIPNDRSKNALIDMIVKAGIDMSANVANNTSNIKQNQETSVNYQGSRKAKNVMSRLIDDLPLMMGEKPSEDQMSDYEEIVNNAIAVQRAKEHLKFLDYFLRLEEEAPNQNESSYFIPAYPR